MDMQQKTEPFAARCAEITALLETPYIACDVERSILLLREQKRLLPIVRERERFLLACAQEAEAKELLAAEEDSELLHLAAEQLEQAQKQKAESERVLCALLVPRDENDDKSVIVEIRGGAGGEEAALFCAVLYRTYRMYAEEKGFSAEQIYANETELGGYKEISFAISGEGAYACFKYESGVHRVQRVPETESSGRIHTSTVTVAVLPEAASVEVEVRDEDLEIDTHRASGAGGQHINKTDSAIRILHKPTGIVVECQDERSQHKNREKALRVLRSKLYEREQKKQADAIADKRKSQVGTGDRSERIRTYNYPQGRVTDHRIGLTLYHLEAILNGKLDELVIPLAEAERAARMKEQVL